MNKKTEKDILLEHEYDGIQELDNDLPPWWLYLFYTTIVIAIVYMFHFHVFNTGDLSEVEYLKEMDPSYVAPAGGGLTYHSPWYATDPDITPQMLAKFQDHIGDNVTFNRLISEAKRHANTEQLAILNEHFPSAEIIEPVAAKPTPTAPTKPTGMVALVDEASLAAGSDIYQQNCAVCHGPQGQGGIGPNMTDKNWIHGGDINDIVHIINVGVPAKGMVPWDKTLSTDKIHQVASFIYTMEGTNPPNPKAPEGEVYQRN